MEPAVKGDHSPGNVKFPDCSLTFRGTPTNSALTCLQLKTAFSHFTHTILTQLSMLVVQTHPEWCSKLIISTFYSLNYHDYAANI